MATKKPTHSKTLIYILLSTLGVVITALVADDSFKEILGSYVVVLYVLDKLVHAYLRVITIKPISMSKPKLNPLEEALRDDNDYLTKDV